MGYTIRPLDSRATASLKAVGHNIKYARTWQGLSQRQLEYLSRVDQTTISRLERGLAPGLRLERLAAIMAVLGIADLRPIEPSIDGRR